MARLLAIPLCLLLLATAGAGVSGAFFAASQGSKGSSARAGTIDLDGLTDGTAVIDAGLLAGGSATTVVRLRNAGDVPGTLLVTPRDPVGTLRPALDLRLELCAAADTGTACSAATTVFSGGFDAVTDGVARTLVALPVGAARNARITLSWPAGRPQPAGTPTASMNLRWTLRTVAS